MAANLTPQYYKAEDAYRKAQTAEDRLIALREMLRVIPKHKGTDHLQGAIKAKLKEVREAHLAQLKAGSSGRSYRIPRQGCGTVVVVGGPNSGKSRLVSELSNAHPEVAEFPFTTREPTAGMMKFDGVVVQLIDTPPISENFIEPYVVDFVRTADLVLCCFNGQSDDAVLQTIDVLQQLEMRKTVLSDTSGFDPADFSIVHLKSRLVVTRGQSPDASLREELLRESIALAFPSFQVDLASHDDLTRCQEMIVQSLNVMRIYTKRPGVPVEYVDPFVIPQGGTVQDLARKVHEQLADRLKFARVWGQSAHGGQAVGRDHMLSDRDVVELHL